MSWSREELLSGLKDPKLRAACEEDPKWNQFVDEYNRQAEEHIGLVEEIEKLKKRNAESKQVKILELRKQVARSKLYVAINQRDQREHELVKSQLEDDLKAATSHQKRERIQQKLERVDWEAQYYKRLVDRWEEVANRYGEELKQLESTIKEEEKRQEKQSKKLLNDALKAGFVEVVIVVCIILGQPGVGKTHVKYLLLDRRPPHLRSSTICAETPVRVEIRTVSGSRVQNIRGNWKEVSDEEMLDIVARMILVAEPELSQKPDGGIVSKVAKLLRLESRGSAGAKLPNIDSGMNSQKEAKSKHTSTTPNPTLSDTCQKAVNEIMNKLLERITKLRSQEKSLADSRETQSLSEIILNSKWVYFTDSGGQPQFHELLPLFVRSISSALCVTRLTDRLDETQEVELYQGGKQVGAIQQSQLSAKDTIQCLVNTIQSYSSQEQPPQIIMIGTHLDKLEEAGEDAVETLEEKDKKLLEMLKPEFSNQLVYSSQDMKKLIFPVNALNPGDKERSTAQSVRCHVEDSGAKKVKIPIWWYIMELLLQELARKLDRGVLSRAECLEMARLLRIREDSFDAALKFFDKLNVVKYSPDVLPNVVFVDSQIPLDKVSELVHHSFLLRQPASAEDTISVDGEWQHFRDKGVVSKKCLEHFKRHYIPKIFSMDDLSELLKSLLLFAPIQSRPGAPATADSAKAKETHFVMPALLITLREAELEKYRISSPELATLLVRFPHHSRRAGVFCCFVVHLINHFGWRSLLLDEAESDGEPLYRNCIKMHLPTNPPCSITLIDSNGLIEVHVKLAAGANPGKCSALLNVIKNAILSGIDAACKALNYKHTTPEFTFHCPHSQPASQTSPAKEMKRHTATLNDKKEFLTCDLDRDNSYRLQPKHLIWFGHAQASSELSTPTARTSQSQDTHSTHSSSGPHPPDDVNTRPGDALLAEYVCISATGAAEELGDMSSGPVPIHLPTSTQPTSAQTTSSDNTSTSSGAAKDETLSSTPSGGPPTQSMAVRSTAQSTSDSASSYLPHIPEYVSISATGAAEDLSDMSKPSLSNLTVIKWKNEKGEVKKFRLKQSIIHRWRNIGDLVVPRQLLEVWAKRRDDEESCRAVLSYWLDHSLHRYPATWEGLYELLEDSELGQVAIELRQAVDNAI